MDNFSRMMNLADASGWYETHTNPKRKRGNYAVPRLSYCALALLFVPSSLSAAQDTPHNSLTPAEAGDKWVLVFDGKTTKGWIVDGESQVVDGVLVIGGSQPTRAGPAFEMGDNWELRLEYRTEEKQPMEVSVEWARSFARSRISRSLDRMS